ncbi:hypothetical protein ABN254_21535, partial [Providencia rettgeri]
NLADYRKIPKIGDLRREYFYDNFSIKIFPELSHIPPNFYLIYSQTGKVSLFYKPHHGRLTSVILIHHMKINN